MRSTDKKYYQISEVADILGIPTSTLRFWESRFSVIKPNRTKKGRRIYTPEDIEKVRMVWFLLKEKGLKLEAAEQQLSQNRRNVSKRYEVVERLYGVRNELLQIENALTSLWKQGESISDSE